MNLNKAYTILELDFTASEKEIKEAFARLSKVFHPEEQPEKYKLIYSAYKTAMQSLKAKNRQRHPDANRNSRSPHTFVVMPYEGATEAHDFEFANKKPPQKDETSHVEQDQYNFELISKLAQQKSKPPNNDQAEIFERIIQNAKTENDIISRVMQEEAVSQQYPVEEQVETSTSGSKLWTILKLSCSMSIFLASMFSVIKGPIIAKLIVSFGEALFLIGLGLVFYEAKNRYFSTATSFAITFLSMVLVALAVAQNIPRYNEVYNSVYTLAMHHVVIGTVLLVIATITALIKNSNSYWY